MLEHRALFRPTRLALAASALLLFAPLAPAQSADAGAGLRGDAGWPRWQGPRLPEELRGSVQAQVRRPGVVVSRQPLPGEDLHLVLARPDSAADLLTFRQAQIASEFAVGKPYRQIADELQISPVTVRNHLRTIYSVLQVRSKVELSTAMDAAPRLGLHGGVRLSR